EFEKQTSGIFQGQLIWTGERIILFVERMDRAHQVEWRLGVGHAPDATFRKPLSRANRECKQKRKTKQERGDPTGGNTSARQKHFRCLTRKISKSIASSNGSAEMVAAWPGRLAFVRRGGRVRIFP